MSHGHSLAGTSCPSLVKEGISLTDLFGNQHASGIAASSSGEVAVTCFGESKRKHLILNQIHHFGKVRNILCLFILCFDMMAMVDSCYSFGYVGKSSEGQRDVQESLV